MNHPHEPRRWAEGAAGDQVADLFRAVRVPVRFDERAVVRALAQGRRSRPRLAVAVGCAIALSATVVVAASGLPRRWFPAPRSPSFAARGPSSAAAPAGRPVPRFEPLPAPPAMPTAPAPASAPAGPPRRRAIALRVPVSPAPAPAAAPEESALGRESRVLGAALARLRVQHDAAGALAALDEYARAFPDGVLGHEAAMARADALLGLGRDAQALSVLDGLALGAGARERELRLIRAELRARTDCGPAIADFDAVLAAGSPAALIERALYGRAVCRARGGDSAPLHEYLRRYPHGRFAAEARRRLGAE